LKREILFLAINAKYVHTSLTVRYLREACRKVEGCSCDILELTINHQLLEILGEVYTRKPAVLGIACYIWNIELVKQLLKLLSRVMPETVIVCGGPEVTYGTAGFLRDFPMVDYVVRGEGEEAMPALLRKILQADGVQEVQPEDIPGLAWRDRDGAIHEGKDVVVADISCLPFPYQEAEMAALKERILYYETARGCPFSCAYCLSCATKGVRYLPIDRVLKELAFLVRHDVRQVKFVDRTFNASKRHFLPILRYVQQLPRGCRTNFHFEAAIDYLDEEVLAVLAAMPKGRVQLEIGIQSTNLKTLGQVSRVNHWDLIASHITRILGFHNIHVHVDLIIGLPEEGMASFGRSFNDVYALQPDKLQLGFLKFLKGAAMMSLVAAGSYAYMDMAPYEVLQTKWLSYGEIRWFHSFEAVFEYYYNAGRCRHTMAYLIRTEEAGDAFAFYRRFTNWWESCGYHKVGHATKDLYGYLQAFAMRAYALPETLLDNLLRYDALLADGGRIRPEYLHWNREKYQKFTAAFWRSEAPLNYLPAYKFTNWRAIRQHYAIEVFEYDVERADQERLKPARVALLFGFAADAVSHEAIDLLEG
jgi:radical SAM superfamily enzyme YgiQ (UPF0313 family)